MRKLVLGIMATALAGCMFTGAAMAGETEKDAELLPGSSNIIYICSLLQHLTRSLTPSRLSDLQRLRNLAMK